MTHRDASLDNYWFCSVRGPFLNPLHYLREHCMAITRAAHREELAGTFLVLWKEKAALLRIVHDTLASLNGGDLYTVAGMGKIQAKTQCSGPNC